MAIVRPSGKSARRLDDIICDPLDIAEICYVADHQRNHYSNCVNILRAHRLVRQGFLSRQRYSEHPRHLREPRFYWWQFDVTDKGREFILKLRRKPPAVRIKEKS